jgi:cell surface protein SprA
VNIEENSERVPVPYVVPPGIEREINMGATNLQQMNEQSLDLKVCNLLDGDSRAVYKTCDFDMRQFKKLQMFVHGEAGSATEPLNDGDLSVFIRLGSDFTSNFYEYEVPIVVTPWGTSKDQADVIWPTLNNIEITLEDLVNAKKDRNTALREDGSPVSITTPYITWNASNNKIVVVGNPSLSAVKTIMIGIRNPKKTTSSNLDDGNAKCAEVWVNELRLTDFAEDGGWAATARINAALADFGNLSLAGTISTPGFGSIDKKINERSKETLVSYDIATNLELGKFFPEKWGLKIPMHYDFSELRSTPQYNPLNPDILYKEDLSTYGSKQEKDSIRKMTQDYTRRQSLNFMNVRKTKVSGSSKAHIWDVENLDVSYAFTEIYHRNVDIEYDLKKTHRGGLGYNYTGNPKPFKPLDKVKFLNNKYLRIVKDFNFYYMPKLLSFRTDLDKQFSESLMRNKTNAILILEPTYIKSFNWTRDYGLKWDITQNLKLDYNANANARVDEPPGRIDKTDPNYKVKRDSVWTNILDFGRLTTYQQNIDVTYALPINKLPFLSWVTATAKYGGNYQWRAMPLTTDSLNNIIENPMGNTIENSNTQQLNVNANLVNLYNYIPYLKKLNDKKRQSQPKPKTNMPSAEDSTENKINWGKEILDNTLSLLMSIKSANLSYQENNGKLLPGFMSKPVALGMDWKQMAPGMDFVFGNPSEIFGGGTDIREIAYREGWMSSDTNLNTPFAMKQSKTLNGQVTLEPLPALRIDITMNSTFSKVNSSYLRGNSDGTYTEYSPIETGSFSMSYITWGTAFVGDKKDNSNAVFEQFKENRFVIAMRLAQSNPNWTGLMDSLGFPDGYSQTSQEVLIPAFLAAYGKKDENKISLKPFSEKLFSSFPLPNWKITYTGLTKIKWIKKFFKNVSVSHSYRNTYSVGSYVTSVRWRDEDGDGYTFIRDAARNFLSQKEIGQISINEQFSPLIGFDMTMVNSLLIKFEIRKTRNLALSFANTQLTEVTSEEYVIGAGYRIKDVSFNINTGGRKKAIKSDLNLKADFSIRSNKTVLRKLVENMDQISAGQRVMSISVSAKNSISDCSSTKSLTILLSLPSTGTPIPTPVSA